jgi:serine/threonine protein kinase
MDKNRWKSIENLFEKAVEVPREERERWLAENCGDDAHLCAEILAMLEADDASGGILDSPVFEAPDLEKLAGEADQDSLPDLIGERLGAYEIMREIGRGGMGAVYLARRADAEFEKLVAIKLIKRGMDTDFILKRFRNERQILATLDNPFIARLIDGGTTRDGLTYFVMEYVEGEPIHDFCDRNRLSIGERLSLFRKVCAAVHYAHENLIIHRDLKPGNILVTDNLDLKLLDFGIAKILNPEFAGDSLAQTITGMRLMTPEYASPEQVKGEELGPASDVYALGVLLYELLVGRRPYAFPSKAPHDVARVICEVPPNDPAEAFLNPSEEEPESPERLSRYRNTTPEAVTEELGGELTNILLKALRKSPKNRYESAFELSGDIAAFLEGKPVSAPALERDRFSLFENSRRMGLALAVLPFRPLGPAEPNGDFLPLALADAVITRLSNLRTIAVRPTSSILALSESVVSDPQQAGRELEATYVLDGRIQHAGGRVRVTAQLIQTEDNKTVWAGHFEEQNDDLLTLQDSISAQVSENLIQSLSGEEGESISARGTENAEAYEAYLRGRFHWHSYTVDGLAKALVYFYEAIALDP